MLALTEEDQFETVAMAARFVEIARVVPPFGAEFGVAEVAARELVPIARHGLPKIDEGCEEHEEKGYPL